MSESAFGMYVRHVQVYILIYTTVTFVLFFFLAIVKAAAVRRYRGWVGGGSAGLGRTDGIFLVWFGLCVCVCDIRRSCYRSLWMIG